MNCEASKHNLLERMLLDASAEPTDLPLSLLKEITNDFSDNQQVGKGGFAIVYKGLLQNGTVAVKKLSQKLDVDEKSFNREVSCLMSARHKNIVRFLGYCADTQGQMCNYEGKLVMADVRQRLLCFEFVPNGSLEEHITDASQGLEWSIRYQLIKGICEGLHYLHCKKIFHLDLKPANVLLDYNMIPKIADFGLSRCFDEKQSHAITSKLIGTLGYLAPEFYRGEIRSELDIYSLGVVIIEILRGQKGYFELEDVLESCSSRFGTSQGDTRLEQVRVCAEIGLLCIDSNPAKRPTTKDIVKKLGMESTCSFVLTGICTLPVAPAEKGSTLLKKGGPKVPAETSSVVSSALTQEPATIPQIVSAPAFSHITPIPNVASQGITALQTSSPHLIPQEEDIADDTVQEHKPAINPVQLPVRPGGHGSLKNLSQVHMSNTEVNSLGVTNKSSMNMPIGKHLHAQQQAPKSVKIWQGILSGRRQGQHTVICHLEAYRRGIASETLVLDWPETMEICQLMDERHMNIKYCDRADFLTFQTLNHHPFLGQLQERKMCAVITLPSQVLLLTASEKVGCLSGMLFPGDMVVLKLPVSNSAAINAAAAAPATTTVSADATTTFAAPAAARAYAAASPPAGAGDATDETAA